MLSFIDGLIGHPLYDWVDLAALVIVALLSLKLRSIVALVVLLDFALVYFGQNWLRSLSLWGSLGLDYQYTLGVKDTLLAATLLFLAASPWLTLAYIIPALTCWVVWASYSLIEYETFLSFYYAWSPIYALAMFLQVFGLSRGDSSAGKLIRRKFIPANWDRFFQPVNRLIYARIAFAPVKITRTSR